MNIFHRSKYPSPEEIGTFFTISDGILKFQHWERTGFFSWRVSRKYILKELYRFVLREEVNEYCGQIIRNITSNINNLPKKLRDTVVIARNESFTANMAQTKEEALARAMEHYRIFSETGFSAIINESKNNFRKRLLENIRRTAQQIFVHAASRSTAELLLKAREEVLKNDSGPRMISGVHALPQGTRFVFDSQEKTAFVIEQPPQVRTVSFHNHGMVRLSFPFVIFIITVTKTGSELERMRVFFRNEKITSPNDELCCPALPNISSSFVACSPRPAANDNVSRMTEEAIMNFWGSRFNNDWSGNMDAAFASIAGLNSIKTWEQKTSQNAYLACSLPWQSARETVTGAAISALQSESGGQTKNSPLSLDAHVERLGEAIGQRIQEACLELIPKWHIDDATLRIAAEKWKKLVDRAGKDAEESLWKGFGAACCADEIRSAVYDASQEFAKRTVLEIENLSSSATETVVQKLTESRS